MALKIQRLQLVLAVLVAVQENVPAMLNGMVPLPFGPPGRGGPRCIRSHIFGSGDQAIHLKPHCERGCSGKEPNDGDKCVGVSGTSGPVLIILSGVCQNKTCKISNESEIYKQEMNVSLPSNDVKGEQIPQLPGCGFTSVQDKARNYLLSTECTACESQLNKTTRPDCTLCIAFQNNTVSGDVTLTLGECHNGTCIPRNPTETVDVKKELILNSN
uniref:Putative secreted protein n=1 Tax=Ixodes ricinus TaxID=34613 RepID=A0A0K8R3E9_IXORI